MNNSFFKELELIQKDTQQMAAYDSTSSTVVIAGPGSGKTRVLTLKAIRLSESLINKPAGLACISYSRETVRELKKRLRSYGYTANNRDFIGTVHSFCLLHIIQPFAHLYSHYNIKYPIKILPDDIRDQIYNSVLTELNKTKYDLGLAEINRHRCLSLEGISTIQIDSSELVENASMIYERKLGATEYIDFTDIINLSAKIIREQEFVRTTLQSRFPWLLIDEYQDLGKALHEMVLELLFNADIKLFAVGDMHQSIYGFNGGYPDFLEELTKYDEVNTIYLSSNYRSTQDIIEASLEALVPTPPVPEYIAKKRIGERAEFSFIVCKRDMMDQLDIVAKKVLPKLLRQGVSLNEIGILVPSNDDVKHMARMLSREGIKFYIAKWSFENSAVVVWLQDCARWCINPSDQPFEELYQFWKRILIEHEDRKSNWENLRSKVFLHEVLLASRRKEIIESWLEYILSELSLADTLLHSSMYPNEAENLQKLVEEAKYHNLKGVSLERFSQLGVPNNEVTITTRHSAKGLEFEAVILLGMEEGRFPYYKHLTNRELLNEDQRLCYVCISRAKSKCVLIRSQEYLFEGRYGPYTRQFSPSRFWITLYNKFGNDQNLFTGDNFA